MKNKKVLLRIILAVCIVFLSVLAYWTILPRQGTLDTPCEGIYTGQLWGMNFHGQVTLTFANGSKLAGDFV